jgi:hypothetical protein
MWVGEGLRVAPERKSWCISQLSGDRSTAVPRLRPAVPYPSRASERPAVRKVPALLSRGAGFMGSAPVSRAGLEKAADASGSEATSLQRMPMQLRDLPPSRPVNPPVRSAVAHALSNASQRCDVTHASGAAPALVQTPGSTPVRRAHSRSHLASADDRHGGRPRKAMVIPQIRNRNPNPAVPQP